MNLHYSKEIFEELIVAASNELGIPTNIIEKDYYVTIILKALSEKISDMVFKGGTSLTKCYHILDRFSEDIDLSYTAESGIPGDSRKRKLKKAVVSAMNEFDFKIVNLDMTRSRRDYNCYRAIYPSIYGQSNILKTEVVVETYVALLPFPTIKCKVDNYIYRFLDKINRIDLAERYDLMPFDITTQTIERTLVDKVFAICDYYLQGKIENHSRHLYDIYKILNVLNDTEQLTNLIPEVRAVRSRLSICPSANDGVSVTNILNEIIKNQVYRNDYDNITMGLLFIPENYDTVIQGIKQIVENGIWN